MNKSDISLLRRSANRGMSLVELMVAITIGTLIVAAMSLLFANNSRSRSETERASQNIENGRYALELVRTELQHAGYFAEFNPRELIPTAVPKPKPDACAMDLAVLRPALWVHVQGYDNVSASTLSCLSDVKAGTDAFLVRRASTCIVGSAGCTALGTGAPAFQASSCGNATELGSADAVNHYRLDTTLTNLVLTKRNCTAVADTRRYVHRIYYIANNDKAGDGIPTLKYTELGAGAFSTPTSLVQGIEYLQLEYGLDTDGNGDADVYTASPDGYAGCTESTTPTCLDHWASTVAVKVFVLSRSVDASPGHTDTNTYVLGLKADGTANTFGPLPGAFKRKVFQEVVRLQNPAGRL